MKKLILLGLGLMVTSSPILAKSNPDLLDEKMMDKKQIEMIEQRMEEEPSSTPIGGSRSGQLEIEKKDDQEKMQHDLEKQKQLYQYEDNYRKGL
jgi:hypothetical protein